jgi:para-nitrobenzyl esterase
MNGRPELQVNQLTRGSDLHRERNIAMKVGRREFLAGISAPLILGASGVAKAATPPGRAGPLMAHTRFGPVIGQPDQGSLAFKGIPYGGSTSGKSRFVAPSPAQAWDEPP